MTRQIVFACLAVAAVAANANAQSLPAEGPVAVTFTSTEAPAAKPMSIGDGKEYTLLTYAMTASNDAGNPILNNMGGRCLFERTVDTTSPAGLSESPEAKKKPRRRVYWWQGLSVSGYVWAIKHKTESALRH
jgi:hypothetical protein